MKRICAAFKKGIPQDIWNNKKECPEKIDRNLIYKSSPSKKTINRDSF